MSTRFGSNIPEFSSIADLKAVNVQPKNNDVFQVIDGSLRELFNYEPNSTLPADNQEIVKLDNFSGRFVRISTTTYNPVKKAKVNISGQNTSTGIYTVTGLVNSGIDQIGLTVNPNSITINEDGMYELKVLYNMRDVNTHRIAHISRVRINGLDSSVVYGENYIRDISAHDDSSIRHYDLFELSAGDVLSFTLQSHSVNATSTIRDGWILIEKT